jgi:flagellar motility protein MotE (MotC chaperone)
MRTLRLIPIVVFATTGLFVLKAIGLVDRDGSPFASLRLARAEDAPKVAPARPNASAAQPQPAAQATPAHKRSWAQEMLNYPDTTGSIGGDKPAEAAKAAEPVKGAKPPDAAKPAPQQTVAVKPGGERPLSPGERAVLDRLQERRKELDARSHQLEIREGLVQAAEKRIEARIGELKALDQQIKAATEKKNGAEAARFKGLVAMYENMKPKDAARIFDRLELKVLLDVAGAIKPRTMSEIMAQMSPDVAERVTVELATRANAPAPDGLDKLPKIQGKPKG